MFEQKTEKKAAVFLADGCEEVEALSALDMLFRAGIPVSTVSVKETPVIVSSHAVTLVADMEIGDFHPDQYDIFILPGGIPGTPNLKKCSILTDALQNAFHSGKTIAAICAAPSILAELGMLKGRKACCHPAVEESLLSHGAQLVRTPAAVDGNLITGRGAGCAIDFGLAIVSHIMGENTARQIAEAIVLDSH